jgi:hypothetical protein
MKRVSLRTAFADPALLGPILGGDTWAAWRSILLASQGEALTDLEREAFKRLTNREREPLERVEELWCVIGRRGGKTRAAAALATFMAALCDHRRKLAVGERGVCLLLAQNVKQASIAFGYVGGIFDSVPLLSKLVINRTADTISLSTGVDLEIRAASFRGLRGMTCVAVIADEACFWPSDESANADVEILNAVRPALSTTQGPLIVISSPYAKRGAVFEAYRAHFGEGGDKRILIAKGASRDFNPSLPQSVVDRALERDPAWASAEYLGEFRADLEVFISREAVEALVDSGVQVRAPLPNVRYSAFTDPSGGGGGDSFTCGVAHREQDGTVVLDYVGERPPPFNAQQTVEEFAQVLREYRCTTVTGDKYAGSIVAQSFAACGITYNFSTRDRSQIYVDVLPLMTSGKLRLLDDRKLVAQIASLERRVGAGRDRIDHPDHSHDDIANSACGAAVLAADVRNQLSPHVLPIVVSSPRQYFGDPGYAGATTRNPAHGLPRDGRDSWERW